MLVCCDFRCDIFDCQYETLFNASLPLVVYCEGKKASWHIILILTLLLDYEASRITDLRLPNYRRLRKHPAQFRKFRRVLPNRSKAFELSA